MRFCLNVLISKAAFVRPSVLTPILLQFNIHAPGHVSTLSIVLASLFINTISSRELNTYSSVFSLTEFKDF